ncbi:MAG TPA: OmpA family protein [Pyrinomonadaceae bacterium]|jgi:OOP family OmpA-OmpF porin
MRRTKTKKLWPVPLALLALAACVAHAAAQAEKPYKLEGHEVKVAGAVAFAEGGHRLLPESEKALDAVKTYLDDKQFITTLRVEGHTEAGGDAAANQALSERRALAVARRLVEKGVDCKRLVAVGFGSTKPVAHGDTPENRAKNRRVAFFNAALRGRLIGGAPADGGGRAAGDPCGK